jgi:hypothetical protein
MLHALPLSSSFISLPYQYLVKNTSYKASLYAVIATMVLLNSPVVPSIPLSTPFSVTLNFNYSLIKYQENCLYGKTNSIPSNNTIISMSQSKETGFLKICHIIRVDGGFICFLVN